MMYSKIDVISLGKFPMPKPHDQYLCPKSPTGQALIMRVQATTSPQGTFIEVWWTF
jgi:hypothetical protein